MSEPNLNNPAGRLHYWLQRGSARNHGNSAMGEWCAAFGLDHNKVADRVQCMRRGAMLMRLATEVRREAEQLPGIYHPAVMLQHFGEIEGALDIFTILPGQQMGRMFEQIQGTGWQSLRLLDAMLSTHRPESVVEPDAIRKILAQVGSLIDEILADSDLETDLRRYIVARLRDVQNVLTDALITGAPGVELAANSLMGARHRDEDLWDRIAATRWAPRIAMTWAAIMTTLSAVAGFPALMPGSDEQSVEIHTTVNTTVNTDGSESDDDAATSDEDESADVVDGEIVEDVPR